MELSSEDRGRLGSDHVAVSAGARRPALPAVIARVNVGAVAQGSVGVDQMIRNAVGLELQDAVRLRAVSVPRPSWVTRVAFGKRPHYVMLRVQAADLGIVEQGVALLSPLALDLLGIESGDQIVVEAPSAAGSGMSLIRLRAHGLPEGVEGMRRDLSRGGLTTRFPNAAVSLGVRPDLPWIFLDAKARAGLEIKDQPLAAVRVRASRRYQLGKELRELLLVLVLASVGVVTLIHQVWLLRGLLTVILVLAMLLVRARVKSRIEGR